MKCWKNRHHLGINVREDISALRRDIHISLARTIRGYEFSESGSLGAVFPRELPDWLSRLHKESYCLQKQVDIISSLHYPKISERERNIKDPHPRTYEWLFEGSEDVSKMRSSSNVFDWLHTGRDVFWVSGKAGSGKSTLMKYLYNHSKTRAALREWATGKDLVVAGFFFWSAGTSIQKCQEGLLQSLLMCILKQRPALIPHLCPDRWNAGLRLDEGESWTKTELLEALTRLKTESFDSARFCIFIDGMDEYEGEYLDILRLIKDLTTSGSIKVCVSSRPWNVFEHFYGDNGGKRIILQDLNRTDIWLFTHETLTEAMQYRWSLATEAEYLTLVEEIVERSSGVFLWVFLVVRSLLRGMTNLDTVEELRTRLRELPTELEEFFNRILGRGDRVYGKQAARLYMLQLNAIDSDLSALDVAHFAEEDQFYALRDDVSSRHATIVENLEGITRTRVLARCQDLLEFSGGGVLQFLHRTVKDFLETNSIFDQLTKRAGEEFNPHLFICNSMLVQIKAILRHRGPRALNTENFAQSLYPTAHLMRCFWRHTRELAQIGQLPFGLLAALDEASCSLYALSKHCCSCLSLWKSMSAGDYHKGWFADKAVNEGVSEILSLQIGKTTQSVPKNETAQMLPLEVALIHMRSDNRLATINNLLRHGADPNERKKENRTVWGSYLIHFKVPSASGAWKLEIEILESLLRHGADPSLLFDKNLISYESLSAIVRDAPFIPENPWQDSWQRVARDLLIEQPKLPMRPNKRVLDEVETELSKRWKGSPSAPPSLEKPGIGAESSIR